MIKSVLVLSVIVLTTQINAQEVETYLEEFNEPSAHWPVSDNGKKSVEFKNSTILINAYEEGYMKFEGAAINTNLDKDYTIETKVRFILGVRNNGYGIGWGYGSWSNYNAFYISENGFAKLVTQKPKTEGVTVVRDWIELEKKILKSSEEFNVLKIEKVKNKISFFINDKNVFTTEASEFSGIGNSCGYLFQSNIKIAVDYLKISGSFKKINLVENPINGFKLENMGDIINGQQSDRCPLIVPDGKTLFFTSEETINNFGRTDIWFSKFKNNQWEQAIHVGKPLNNTASNFVISVTPDGNSMLIGNTYNADGSEKSSGVSIALKRDGEWGVPVDQKIDNYKNVNGYCNFCLTPDGTRLISAIENEKSLGDLDLFISFLKEDNTWSEPSSLGTVINTKGSEFSPFIAADGKTMYFASEGHIGYGSSDIFVTTRLDDSWLEWSVPKNLGPEINTEKWEAYYCLSAQSDFAYMVVSGLGYGSDDIFRIKVGEDMKPDPVVIVRGKVFNKKTNEIIDADITYEPLDKKGSAGKAFSTKQDGFAIALPKGTFFGFQAKAEGFIPVSENIDLVNLSSFEEKSIDLYLVPIEKGQTIRLNNIFFDFGKSILREESNDELTRLVKLLNDNPSINIEISGHTDNKGSDEYNRKLSDDRAKAVAEYVLSKGIADERITYKGYGESKPVTENTNEEGMQLNRRVEFTIK